MATSFLEKMPSGEDPSFETLEESSSRDHFGFIIPILSPSDKAALLNQPYGFHAVGWGQLGLRKEDWHQAASEADGINAKRRYHEVAFNGALKNLVRHGVPHSLRPTMWYWLSGG